MKTVAIIEGFSGGPKSTKEFREGLEKAGFRVTRNRHDADIIFAHSAGCYDIPTGTKAKLFILLGPPYWPGQHLLKRFVNHAKFMRKHQVTSYGWRYYFRRKGTEFYYTFARPKILWLALTRHEDLAFINELRGKVVLIRNKEDLYCSPEIEQVLDKRIKYIEMPGHHDDYVTSPESYIKLIQSEYERG